MSRHHTYIARKAVSLLCSFALLMGQVPTTALAEAVEEQAAAAVEQVAEPAAEAAAEAAEEGTSEEAEAESEAAAEEAQAEEPATVEEEAAPETEATEEAEATGTEQEAVADTVEATDATETAEEETTEADVASEADAAEATNEQADDEADEGETEDAEDAEEEKEIVLAKQKLKATVYADASQKAVLAKGSAAIELEGMLPEGGQVVAWPLEDVDVADEDVDLLTAYEIKVMVGDAEWQPEDAEQIVVRIEDEATRALDPAAADALLMYHIHDDEMSRIDVDRVAKDGTVRFVTDGFSEFLLGATAVSDIPRLDPSKSVDGVTYYLNTSTHEAAVCGISSPATVHYQVQYGGVVYKVTKLSATTFGGDLSLAKEKELYPGKTVYLDDELVSAMYGGAQFGLPALDATLTSEEAAVVADYTAGTSNGSANVSQQLWKKAAYNPETNQIDISLAFFQKMGNATLDFIFVYDMSDTMLDNYCNMNGYRASRTVWAVAALQLMAKSLLEQNDYSVRLDLIPFTSTAGPESGWKTGYSDVKDFLASSWTYGGTNHGNAASAAATAANSSKNTPVVVYISDIVSHIGLDHVSLAEYRSGAYDYNTYIDGELIHDYKQLQDMRKAASNRVYLLKVFNGTSKDKAKDWTGSSDRVKIADDVDAFIGGLSEIIKESVGYYIDNDVTVTDELSSGLMALQQGITLSASGANGALSRSGSTLTWKFANGGTRLNGGVLYTQTAHIDLASNALVSGSLPTNGACTVTVGEKTVNSVNPPQLERDLSFAVRCHTTGAAIDGASFELLDASGAKVWEGTSENGRLTIPYAQVSFPAGSTYTLRQTATDATHLLPTGSWKLSVGTNCLISVSTQHGSGYDASQPNANPDWMVDATVKNGTLVLENRSFATITLKNHVKGNEGAEGLPIFLFYDAYVNDTTLNNTVSMPSYVCESDGSYTLLPTYVEQSSDTYNGMLYVRSGKQLSIVVPDQPADVAYRLHGAVFESYNGEYVPVEGSFSVTMSDSETNATVTHGNWATHIVNGGTHVTGSLWNMQLAGTLPVAGTTIVLGGEEASPAYIRVQNHTSQTLKFRLTVDGGAYGNQAGVESDSGNRAGAKGGYLVEKGSAHQVNMAPLGSTNAHYYEFVIEANKESHGSKTYFVPFAAGLSYGVRVFAQDGDDWTEITDDLEAACVRLSDERKDGTWVSDALAGTLVAGLPYRWSSKDDNSFLDTIATSGEGERKMVNIALVDYDPNPPAPTGVRTHDDATQVLAVGSVVAAGVAAAFARRRHEDEDESTDVEE